MWLRASETVGHVGLLAAAEQDLTGALARYFRVRFDFASGTVDLLKKTEQEEQAKAIGQKAWAFPARQWSRVKIRLEIMNDGQAAIGVYHENEFIIGAVTPLAVAGTVGIVASSDFSGFVDNLEILSFRRLDLLPAPAAPHELALKYRPATGSGTAATYDVYRHRFLSSRYLDFFDHLNSWDRRVWRSGVEPIGPVDVGAWVDANGKLLHALGDIAAMESRYAVGNATPDEMEVVRRALVTCRFELDSAFDAIAATAGLELSALPERFEMTVAQNGAGLLMEMPEPLDWTTVAPRPMRKGGIDDPIPTRLAYTSDFTRVIVLLEGATLDTVLFDAGATYTWTIERFSQLPLHLAWLEGWVGSRSDPVTLTLEIP
jgi:hypothetical protein